MEITQNIQEGSGNVVSPLSRFCGNSCPDLTVFIVMAENKTDKNEEGQQTSTNNTLELPMDMLIKHPLQHTWTLWYFEKTPARKWEDCQNEITSFDTVEDFWSLYNHIKPASEMRAGCDYSLFKKGIMPMWEDKANKKGGRWLVGLDKRYRETTLDDIWLEMLLCMVGEAFDEHSDEVCGAVVNVRPRMDKLSVWTGDYSRDRAVMEIGRRLKERLNLNLSYEGHKDTAAKSSSVTKVLYSV